MPFKQINARDLILEVSDMTTPTPVWAEVGGITEAGVNYGENEETDDTTTFDDAGVYRQEVMQRGSSLAVSGRSLRDDVTGSSEPGQLQLNLHAGKVGSASQVNVRFRYPPETMWTVWTCTVSRGNENGGNNAHVGFAYTLTKCGAATSVAVTP